MTRGRWGPKWGQGRGVSFGEKLTAWSRGGRRMGTGLGDGGQGRRRKGRRQEPRTGAVASRECPAADPGCRGGPGRWERDLP